MKDEIKKYFICPDNWTLDMIVLLKKKRETYVLYD